MSVVNVKNTESLDEAKVELARTVAEALAVLGPEAVAEIVDAAIEEAWDVKVETPSFEVVEDADGRERTVFADGSYVYGWRPALAA